MARRIAPPPVVSNERDFRIWLEELRRTINEILEALEGEGIL